MMKRIPLLLILGGVLSIGGILINPVNGTARKPAITQLSLDPDAHQVNLFKGIEEKSLSARVFAKSAYSSDVFISNLTHKPLTVKIPPAVSSVHILAQVDPGNGFLQGLQGNPQTQNGDSQAVGGNLAPIGVGNNSFFDLQGMFTIPPEKTVRLKLRSVCLEHGKPCPSRMKTYELRPVETKVKDKALVLLLERFNPRRDDWETMQAAAWHLGSHVSWQDLASKRKNKHIGGGVPYFSRTQLMSAQKVVELARIESHRQPSEKKQQLVLDGKNSSEVPATSGRRSFNRP